jgi:uncharacterized protein YdhG (YjbR/CyaY superfamily)
MKKENQYSTFDEYIENQAEDVKAKLLELSDCILQIVPNAIKLINYNIPAFALIEGGKRDQQIMIAGYKKHIGFYPHPTTMEKFWDELGGYKKAKGSVQFPLTKPLPKELIKKMVKYRKELIEKE